MPGQVPNACSSVTNVCSRVKVIYLKGYDKVAFVEQGSKCLKLSCQLNWEQLGHWHTACIAINNTSFCFVPCIRPHGGWAAMLKLCRVVGMVETAQREFLYVLVMFSHWLAPCHVYSILLYSAVLMEAVSLGNRLKQTKQGNWATYKLYFGAGVQ